MRAAVRSARRVPRSLILAALGSSALWCGGSAQAGFELTPPAPVEKPASATLSPLPGVLPAPVRSVDAVPLAPKGVATGKPVVLDMKPLDNRPAAAPMREAFAPRPVPVAPSSGGLTPDEMLPLPNGPSVKSVEAQRILPPPNVPLGRPAPVSASVVLPMAASPAAGGFQRVEGFGRDVPLALAMRQIVPPGYAFSFDQGVDPGRRVSWTGGAPWNEVLQNALAPSGLGVGIDGATVVVGVQNPAASQSAPSPGSSAFPGRERPMDVPPVSSAWVAPPPPRMAGQPTRLQPLMKASPSGEAPSPGRGVESESLVPFPAPSSPDAGPSGKMASPTPTALPVFAPPSAASKPVATSLSSAPQGPFKAGAVREWSARSGSSLRQILSQWSREAGVHLYWSSQYDYPVQANVFLNGTYEKAVATLLDGLRDAQPRPLGRLHPNPPDGPAVLIIETRHIVN